MIMSSFDLIDRIISTIPPPPLLLPVPSLEQMPQTGGRVDLGVRSRSRSYESCRGARWSTEVVAHDHAIAPQDFRHAPAGRRRRVVGRLGSGGRCRTAHAFPIYSSGAVPVAKATADIIVVIIVGSNGTNRESVAGSSIAIAERVRGAAVLGGTGCCSACVFFLVGSLGGG